MKDKISLGAFCAILTLTTPNMAQEPYAGDYEGFGSVTQGALSSPDGYEVYHVTSLLDDGSPGTLRDAVSAGKRYIVFDVSGTIRLTSTLNAPYPYVTIDGSSAPSPGITLDAPRIRTAIEARNSVGPAHDIIIRYLRVKGSGGDGESLDIWELDGSKHAVYNIVLDHITAIGASDGVFDIYGEVRDVTISNNLIMDTVKMLHLSSSGKVRERISFHHNVFARNNERQIRMRHHNDLIDFVNNVIYGWGWFEGGAAGLHIGSNTGVPNDAFPTLNVENNVFHYASGASHGSPDDALKIEIPGKIYFSGNLLPEGENDAQSTSSQNSIPAYAQVTKFAANSLGSTVVPFVGTHFRSSEETNLLNSIQADITTGPADNIPPSVPASLQSAAVSHSEIELSWTSSTDNIGVLGYRVFRDGSLAGTTTSNSFQDTGLSAETAYSYTVVAFDGAGNTSSNSSSSSATTEAAPTSGTLDIRVRAGSDDAEESIATGDMNLTSSDLELISDGTTEQLVGIRFSNIDVPQGSTIVSAYLQFEVDEADSQSTTLAIQAEASDNAPTFNDNAHNISSRARTSGQTGWTPGAWNTGDNAHTTPDLSPVIQEVVDRSGWTSGNSIAIIISGSGKRTAVSYNGIPSQAALLHIEYDSSGGEPAPLVAPSDLRVVPSQ